MSRHAFVEGLESRTFLSATPAPVVFNSTIKIDRLDVRIDLLKFKIDIQACDRKLTADRHKIHKVTPVGDTSLDAGFAQLNTDYLDFRTNVLQDHLTDGPIVLAAQTTVKLDIVQIKKDKHNANALPGDHAKLMTDRIALQTALINALGARINDRTAFEGEVATDTDAIVQAALNDPLKTPAFTAATDKFAADRTDCVTKLTTDLQTIQTARQKLSNDLTAAQST